jgi:SHS2 domain-containing protein
MTASWEHFHHGADIGVRGIAESREEAFVQAALAMSAVITELDCIQNLESVEIRCQAPDEEILLIDWLNALIYEMATRKMLFGRFELSIEGDTLRGKAWGEAVDRERHQPVVEIKGATFTELKVSQDRQGRWVAQCVVDV